MTMKFRWSQCARWFLDLAPATYAQDPVIQRVFDQAAASTKITPECRFK